MIDGDDPPCCPDCGSTAVAAALARKDAVIADLERDLRSKRTQIRSMKGSRDEQDEANPYAREAKVVFSYWQKRISPKAREFKGERFAAVVARLRAGYTVPELKRAIDGAAARPLHDKKTGEPIKTELGTICRSEPNVQMFISFAPPPPPVGGNFNESQVDETLGTLFGEVA